MELPVIPPDTRREFLAKTLAGMGITLCAGGVSALLGGCESFEKKNPVTTGSGIVELDVTTVPEFATLNKGVKRILNDTKGVVVNDGYPVIITKIAENQFVALTGLCTHEACHKEMRPPDPDTVEAIFCGCHGSNFDHTNGAVLSPPATKPLKMFPSVFDPATNILRITFT